MARNNLISLTAVIEKLVQLKVQIGVVEDVKKLQRTTGRIQALLIDAEQMEIPDESTKLWITELTEVCSETQDLIDELEYETVKAQVEYHLDDSSSSGDAKRMKIDLNLPSSSSRTYINLSLVLTDIIADRIERINERLDEIQKYRQYFRVTSQDGARRPNCAPKYPLPTSHLFNTSETFGREDDKSRIVSWLLSDRSSNLAVFSVVGKGGLGKTTVAQLVYNEPEVSELFDQRIWLCVSLDFDVVKLTKQIVETVTRKACNLTQLGSLHDILHAELAKKRILLVLDDVWNLQRSLWESFIIPFDSGRQVTRIIVTTRNETISRIIGVVKPYRLSFMPEDECWKLFKCRAFAGRNSSEYPRLEDIGMKIVKKSGGLPLVVKSIGGILQDSTDEERWNDILESKLWELEENNEILPIIQLSYFYLPTCLKPCFLSCAVFPKDYQLIEDEVVHLWIALGYIQTKSQSMEDKGKAFFDELCKRSFFDLDDQYLFQGIQIFKMHDSIHDLALYVSNNGCSALSSNYSSNLQSTQKVRALVCSSHSSKDPLPSLSIEIKYIRYMVLKKNFRVPTDLFCLYNLRVLVIVSSTVKELPHQIGALINLIYLRFCTNDLRKLPESICQLRNLVIIDLIPTWYMYPPDLQCLPGGLGNLSKLERLYCHASIMQFKAANVNELRELKNLASLRGTICINNIKYLLNVEDAKEANLKNKPHVEELRLSWSYSDYRFCDNHRHLHLTVCDKEAHLMKLKGTMKNGEGVIENLQPNINLKCLKIKDYDGAIFPSWLGDPSFTALTEIHIIGCKASCLPTLGQLSNLQYLEIHGLSNVRVIGNAFFRDLSREGDLREDEKVAFPSLLKLYFWHMHLWEDFQGMKEHDFPQLQELTIRSCPKLKRLPVMLVNNLTKFIHDSSLELVGEIKFLQDLDKLWRSDYISRFIYITAEEKLSVAKVSIKFDQVCKNLFINFSSGQNLKPTVSMKICLDRSGYTSVDFENLQDLMLPILQRHTDIDELCLYDYGGVSFPHWLTNPPFTKLKVVVISGCKNMKLTCLPTLGQLPSLTYIRIQKVLHLKKIGHEFHRFALDLHDNSMDFNKVAFPSLEELVLEDMPELEEWCGILVNDFPRLQSLRITDCPRLTNTPFLPFIRNIILKECNSLNPLILDEPREDSYRLDCEESVYRYRRHHVLISGCTKITLLPTLGQLQYLCYLKIEKIIHVKTIGYEFCKFSTSLNGDARTSDRVAFPFLKELEFDNMPELEEWTGVLHGDFPSLKCLTIANCPKLTSLPIVPSSVSELCLWGCSSLKSIHLAPDNECPSSLLKVELQNCWELQTLAGMHNLDCKRIEFLLSGCPLLDFRP